MNEPSSTDLSPPRGSSSAPDFRVKIFISLGLMIPVLVFLAMDSEQLLLGWLYFPLRTVPQMTIEWPSVIVGTVSVMLFVIGLHRSARWLMRSFSMEHVAANRWTWRSTLVASAALLVLFASGTALVGIAHQVIWLLSGRHDAAAEAVSPRELGVLASLRASARQHQARNDLKHFGLAFHNFHDTYGAFPPGGTMNQEGELLHGWAMFIGPYHSWYAHEVDFSRSWRVPPNDRIYKCQASAFLNPSQPGPVFDADGFGLCHWAGNVHVLPVRTILSDASTGVDDRTADPRQLSGDELGLSLKQITDGTSTTILLGTVGTDFRPWGYPANVRDPARGINRSPEGFGGPPGWNGGMFAMCDGSVGFLSDKTDLTIMKALATPAGGESLPNDFSF